MRNISSPERRYKKCSDLVKIVWDCVCTPAREREELLIKKKKVVFVFLVIKLGLPQWLSGKRTCLQRRRYVTHKFDPGLGRSAWGGNGNPLQCSCWEKSHVQRSLAVIELFKLSIFSSIWMSYIFLGMCVFVDFKCPDIKPYTIFSYLLTSTTSVIIILFSFLTSVIQIFLLFKNIILTKVYLVLSYNQHFSLFIFYYIFIFYFIVLYYLF